MVTNTVSLLSVRIRSVFTPSRRIKAEFELYNNAQYAEVHQREGSCNFFSGCWWSWVRSSVTDLVLVIGKLSFLTYWKRHAMLTLVLEKCSITCTIRGVRLAGMSGRQPWIGTTSASVSVWDNWDRVVVPTVHEHAPPFSPQTPMATMMWRPSSRSSNQPKHQELHEWSLNKKCIEGRSTYAAIRVCSWGLVVSCPSELEFVREREDQGVHVGGCRIPSKHNGYPFILRKGEVRTPKWAWYVLLFSRPQWEAHTNSGIRPENTKWSIPSFNHTPEHTV
jgi:hypothetical protein